MKQRKRIFFSLREQQLPQERKKQGEGHIKL